MAKFSDEAIIEFGRGLAEIINDPNGLQIPEVPGLPDYYHAIFISRMLGLRLKQDYHLTLMEFLRHLESAISSYQIARKNMMDFVHRLGEEHYVQYYQRALTGFEISIVQGVIATELLVAFEGLFGRSVGLEAADDRMRRIGNNIRHKNEHIGKAVKNNGERPGFWLTKSGLSSVGYSTRGKEAHRLDLSYADFAGSLNRLANFANQTSGLITIDITRPRPQ